MEPLAAAMAWLAIIDARIWQALIAGTFLAVGWLVNGWQNRRRDAKLRSAKVMDLQRALYAEIRAYVAVLERDESGDYAESISRKIRTEAGFFPIIPHERNRTIFSAVIGEIHVLPRRVIDPVALYYSQLVAIETMIEDLREIDKATIGADRAARIYEDYIAMKRQALSLGRDAMVMMGGFLSGGPDRVREIEEAMIAEERARLMAAAPMLRADLEALDARLSNPGGGRSDR